MVLVQLLKAIRSHHPTDKVVLVSNYTEALDMLGKVKMISDNTLLRLLHCMLCVGCISMFGHDSNYTEALDMLGKVDE